MQGDELRHVLSNLHVARDRSRRDAPHKPLLLLLLLQRLRATGTTEVAFEDVAPRLAGLISRVSPNEGASSPLDRAALPFVHLERSVWSPRFSDGSDVTTEGRRDAAFLTSQGARGALTPEVERALREEGAPAASARTLLETYFNAADRSWLRDEVFPELEQPSDSWNVPAGAELSRAERATRFGGSTYGGIQPSNTSPNVFLYSDPQAGRKNGYVFDGWASDGLIYLYTGEGRLGPQKMRAGNLAILTHREAGRALRLFVAEGTKPGSQAKIQRYVGEFEIDIDKPYITAEALDADGVDRTVLVFRLRPVGVVLNRDVDASESGDVRHDRRVIPVLSEAHQVLEYPTSPTRAGIATKREAQLVARFEEHLKQLGHKTLRYRIRPPGELRDLLTDTYDETAHELYEAKSAPTRDALRRAVGQLLDYRRHMPEPDALKLSILSEARPSDDLLAFVGSLNIDCVYETQPGTYVRVVSQTSPDPRPEPAQAQHFGS
jgi:hypothetical protein